ncbi:MAG: polysaccharide biosynthesis protein PslG [Thermoleophilaceae bacterium]|nr:polysaccharide biosynthesis protein PslG [Thermoleophilaceae bacterium]
MGIHVRELSGAQADRIARGGAQVVRTTLSWAQVQPHRGAPYDWSQYDDLLATTASRRLDLLPVLIGTPPWAAAQTSWPPIPRAMPEFLEFVRAAVARYGPGGRFWRDHRELPARPITAWQVWNEPNLFAFWGHPPDPPAYAELLRRVRTAILREAPSARIVLAGMPRSVVEHPIDDYLSDLYALPGFNRLFDIAAVHAYAGNADEVLSVVDAVRQMMDRNGDGAKPIWVTEFGWASAGPPRDSTRVKDPREQARLLTAAFAALQRQAARDRIGTIIWYDLQDYPRPAQAPDRFVWHTGLFADDGGPKPAWRAFTQVAGGRVGAGSLPAK